MKTGDDITELRTELTFLSGTAIFVRFMRLYLFICITLIASFGCRERCKKVEGPRKEFALPIDTSAVLEIHTPAEVTLYADSNRASQLTVTAQPEVYSALIFETNDEGCVISLNDCFKQQSTVLINAQLTNLNRIGLHTAGKIESGTLLYTDTLWIENSGLGDIDLLARAEVANTTITSSGNVHLSGELTKLNFLTTGSGELHAFGLFTDTVGLTINGSSVVEVYANHLLRVNFINPGTVLYRGNPDSIIVTGEGNLRNANL